MQFSTELLASHMMHLCSSAAMMSYVDNELGGKTIQWYRVWYGAVYNCAVQCSAVQYCAVRYYSALQYSAVQWLTQCLASHVQL